MKFGYARVSTKSQELDLQTNALKAAGCDEIITEVMTGTNNDRPARMEMISKLRKGDIVVVWRLDRFGRSTTDLVAKIEQLNAQGVEFISLQENIDTTSATGKLIFHIFAAMAEFERNLISERTKAGLEAARLRGSLGGRKPKLNENQVARVVKMLTGKDAMTQKEVIEFTGVSKSTIYRVMKKHYEREETQKD